MFPDKLKRALHRLRLHKKPALVFQATCEPVVEMRRPTIAPPELHAMWWRRVMLVARSITITASVE